MASRRSRKGSAVMPCHSGSAVNPRAGYSPCHTSLFSSIVPYPLGGCFLGQLCPCSAPTVSPTQGWGRRGVVLGLEEQRVCRQQSTPLSGSSWLLPSKHQFFNCLHIVNPGKFVLTSGWQNQSGYPLPQPGGGFSLSKAV